MVAVFKIGENKKVNSGEIIEDNELYFRIHSDNMKFDKKQYEFKQQS